ncbi:MAG: hypothetical protein KDD94_03435 [Calditrichaeota bacterium]|nr:hypothetical protein [Calditrichota bacterium]
MDVMIVYHPAFDLYHSVYRFIQILTHMDSYDTIEIEKIRIWDFYLLFPEKLHSFKLKNIEKEIRQIIFNTIPSSKNPYEEIDNNRKVFEKIKPYQMSALKSLASYGIINRDYLAKNSVNRLSKDDMIKYANILDQISERELSVLKILNTYFFKIAVYGRFGLKDRSQLLESRYDI